MIDHEQAMERTGRLIAGILGEGPGPARLEAQRFALAAEARAVIRRAKVARVARTSAAFAVVASVAVAAVLLGRPSPLAFTVGGESTPGPEEAWIANRGGSPLGLTFGDGSRIEFMAGARGRVLLSTTREVRLVLENGSLDADVRSAGRTRWLVDAGPFQVRVSGTQFVVGWDPAAAALDVSVSRGAVVVEGIVGHTSGISLPAGRRLYATGQAVHVGPLQDRDAMAPAGTVGVEPVGTGTVGDPDKGASRRHEISEPSPAGPRVATVEKKRVRPEPPDAARVRPAGAWLGLHVQGRYGEARDAAVAEGFDGLLETLGVGHLFALAESARYARDVRRTREALLALRRRFPDSSQAGTAAFLLGRLAVETGAEPGEGAKWFRTYLREVPDGPLAEEAAGRLIDALLKSGRGAEAREAGAEYLRRYPNGIFAGLARSAVGD